MTRIIKTIQADSVALIGSFLFVLSMIITVMLASASHAGGLSDPVVQPPIVGTPVSVDQGWTGFYAGVQVRVYEEAEEYFENSCDPGSHPTHNQKKCLIPENHRDLAFGDIPEVQSPWKSDQCVDSACAFTFGDPADGMTHIWTSTVYTYESDYAADPQETRYTTPTSQSMTDMVSEMGGSLFVGYMQDFGAVVGRIEGHYEDEEITVNGQACGDLGRVLACLNTEEQVVVDMAVGGSTLIGAIYDTQDESFGARYALRF